jgi:hypothetical protein
VVDLALHADVVAEVYEVHCEHAVAFAVLPHLLMSPLAPARGTPRTIESRDAFSVCVTLTFVFRIHTYKCTPI